MSLFDLVSWIPEIILKEIRKNRESLCLMLESEKDIQVNESLSSISSIQNPIMTWLSRSKKMQKF